MYRSFAISYSSIKSFSPSPLFLLDHNLLTHVSLNICRHFPKPKVFYTQQYRTCSQVRSILEYRFQLNLTSVPLDVVLPSSMNWIYHLLFYSDVKIFAQAYQISAVGLRRITYFL